MVLLNYFINCNIISFRKRENRIIEIPICYHPSFALDIQKISEGNNIAIDEIIQQHHSKSLGNEMEEGTIPI